MNAHYPPLAGAGCTFEDKDRKGVDKKLNRIVAVQKCDATGDDKNY
jgi:hypothetical protein